MIGLPINDPLRAICFAGAALILVGSCISFDGLRARFDDLPDDASSDGADWGSEHLHDGDQSK